ncbi:MAG: hypothetical protein E6Z02_08550 [Bifidobacterium breve]|nr:hypothetical protein [Bifidobacterium breve]
MGMSIRLDERRYVEELKRLVADFRMWKNPLVPLPDGFEDDLACGFLGRSKILNLFQLPGHNRIGQSRLRMQHIVN